MADDLPTLDPLVELSPDTLQDYDIALLNLWTANGLPGTDKLNINAILDTLDEWAERVQWEIWRHIYRLDPRTALSPTEFSYGNSLGRFFCWYLLQVLQEDCGVVYHPDRKFNPDMCEPEDVFIHGIVNKDGRGGTCATMPVVYVAVGRRLGFPLYLVGTRGHLFFRWDSPNGTTINWGRYNFNLWIPPDRFNVEGSGEGIAYRSDAHYIQWPELWTEVDFNHGRYLRSQTTAEDVADFLMQRSECFYELGNWEECLKAIYYARKFSPDDPRLEGTHAKRTKEFQNAEQQRIGWVEEMVALRREQAQTPPALPGHPQNCSCQNCRKVRQLEQQQPTDHGPSCRCRNCERIRGLKQTASNGFPGHPPLCQCHQCRTVRQAAQDQPLLPGHLPSCQCAGCLQRKRISPFPHAPNSPQIPGFPSPIQLLVNRPQVPGLPGT